MLTDEELSELAECLADACRGRRIGYGEGECCPFGALLGFEPGMNGLVSHPGPTRIAISPHSVPYVVVASFMNGFDDEINFLVNPMDELARALGRLFREEYCR